MRWYFKSQGAACLGTGIQIRQNMGSKYELERDHIFAYSVLRDSEYFDMNDRFDYALAQEMTNRAILTRVENRRKSAKFADIYLTNIKEQFPNALKMQCIPENTELWKIENYKLFLQDRRELLTQKLNQFLNNISLTPGKVKTEVDLIEVIQSGEHGFLEFKSSMRWNLRESKTDKKIEEVILKSISAFSNSEGGKLLIGVADNGEVVGLQDDYNTLKDSDKDYFELHLRNLLNAAFGKNFAATKINIKFPVIDENEICEIDINAGTNPLFLEVMNKNGQKQKKFYVRSGNSSQELAIDEATSYVKTRFEN